MSDDARPNLRIARQEEIEDTLSYAMRFDGRKRVRHADDPMARITAAASWRISSWRASC